LIRDTTLVSAKLQTLETFNGGVRHFLLLRSEMQLRWEFQQWLNLKNALSRWHSFSCKEFHCLL